MQEPLIVFHSTRVDSKKLTSEDDPAELASLGLSSRSEIIYPYR